jgi:protein-tyrosine phosphatase
VLDLQPAVAEDAPDLHALREAAARWLLDRGIDQWRPGEIGLATFSAQTAAGEWFVDRLEGSIRAALRFLWADPQFWGPRPDDAGYVHGLMIRRRHAGEGLGAAALRWAEERARRSGFPPARTPYDTEARHSTRKTPEAKASGVHPGLPGRADAQVRRARPCRRGCTRCTR